MKHLSMKHLYEVYMKHLLQHKKRSLEEQSEGREVLLLDPFLRSKAANGWRVVGNSTLSSERELQSSLSRSEAGDWGFRDRRKEWWTPLDTNKECSLKRGKNIRKPNLKTPSLSEHQYPSSRRCHIDLTCDSPVTPKTLGVSTESRWSSGMFAFKYLNWDKLFCFFFSWRGGNGPSWPELCESTHNNYKGNNAA